MNNIAQHFATAWFDLKLKGDQTKAGYLNLVEDSAKGVWATNEDGSFKSEHTYWKGFANRTAVGLHLEHRVGIKTQSTEAKRCSIRLCFKNKRLMRESDPIKSTFSLIPVRD